MKQKNYNLTDIIDYCKRKGWKWETLSHASDVDGSLWK